MAIRVTRRVFDHQMEAQLFSSTIIGLADMELNVRYALVVEW
jgi:hypothetical protein